MNDTIRKQIMAVQATGETNMLDIPLVQVIANRMGFYELVVYLEELILSISIDTFHARILGSKQPPQ